MGLSFEELLGGLGRWLDRTWTDVSWWWRSRGPFSGGSSGWSVRDHLDRAVEWCREQAGRLNWWLTTRGVSMERARAFGGGSASWKGAWKWALVAVLVAVVFLLGRNAARPEPPAPIQEAEIALLHSLRVPVPKERRVEMPTAKPESGLKAWLMNALGLR